MKRIFILLAPSAHGFDVVPGSQEIHFREELSAVRPRGALHPAPHMGATGVVVGKRVRDWVINLSIAPEQLCEVPASRVNVRIRVCEVPLGKASLLFRRRPFLTGGL